MAAGPQAKMSHPPHAAGDNPAWRDLERCPTGLKRAAALRYAPAGAGATQGEGQEEAAGGTQREEQ